MKNVRLEKFGQGVTVHTPHGSVRVIYGAGGTGVVVGTETKPDVREGLFIQVDRATLIPDTGIVVPGRGHVRINLREKGGIRMGEILDGKGSPDAVELEKLMRSYIERVPR